MNLRCFLATAFVAFAFFFGAGNLIFPPFAGIQSGTNYISAYIGYILIDVGLAILAIVSITIAKRASFLTVDLPKKPATCFWIAIYTILGPLVGTPRTAVVPYDIGFTSFVQTTSHWPLLLFTVLFFAATLWMVLFPGKLGKIIGEVLTPVLLLCLLVMFIFMLFIPGTKVGTPAGDYIHNPFGQGLLQGYLTLDTVAGLAFGAVIVNTVRSFNITCEQHVMRITIFASLLAGILLAGVYFGLFYMGAISQGIASHATNGGQVLALFVNKYFGLPGQIVLAVIILLACLTTSVGLVTACAEYFHFLYKKISYKSWAVLLTILSFCIANMGLDRIITISIPIVLALYPLTIVVIFAAIVRKYISIDHRFMLAACLVTLFFGFTDVMNTVTPFSKQNLLARMPFFEEGLSWLLPCVIIFILGIIMGNLKGKRLIKPE
ncbi:MAG: branched-chain amino acid transport system II carrier protein [Endozoicomonadaceae bacterium]|nr:branched-chain amino acid transport system II carrier protein [Endozoicomonadaceae bacterium]